MKRILALILAALLTASVFTACEDNEQKETETNTPIETESTEVDETETKEPGEDIVTEPCFVTENGEAKAHIVVAEGTDTVLSYGAEELVYHINKVSGATVTVETAPLSDSLSIVIGTPETNPDLETLFPDDIAWLSTLEEDGKQYGDDGFAIRTVENTVYIFGMTSRGALNGVYDFIEENMGVLWIRANEDIGLIYDEMPTITVEKTDYREKSSFQTRGWHTCGIGDHDGVAAGASDKETVIMMSRNKLNAKFAELGNSQYWSYYQSIGLTPYALGHYMKYWVVTSPIYDSACTEYWNTDEDGNLQDATTSTQVNYWSELTADTIAASVIDFLSKNDTKTVGIGVEDNDWCYRLPESTEPFEYAPGQFVYPGDSAYISTIYFTFMNRIARQVKEAYPDVTINTYAYWLVEKTPLCEIEDNIAICIAPILEDMSSPITDPDNKYNYAVYELMENWSALPNDLVIYNYYGCSGTLARYERPIWDRMQADFLYYVEAGIVGTVPEGVVDAEYYSEFLGATTSDVWAMNTLTFWLYSKLAWNPYEDVDALITYYCDKVYGAASAYMREYYALLEKSWYEAEYAEDHLWNFKLDEYYYFDVYVYLQDLEDDFLTILRAAYEAADTDEVRARISVVKDSFELEFVEY